MNADSSLLQVLGGVALLIWATRLVRTGVERAFGERIRHVLAHATRNRGLAMLSGVAVAGALQSSSAAILLAASFAERNLLPLAAALAFALGADVGSALVVALLSLDLRWFAPVLLIAGVVLFSASGASRWRNIGRAVIGLALVIVALGMIVAGTTPLRHDWLAAAIIQRLDGQPLLALGLSALFALAVQSGLAVVLFVLALAKGGGIEGGLAVALVLGANVGSALVPLWMAWGQGTAARRIVLGNLLFRSGAALALLPFVDLASASLAGWFGPAGLVAQAHIAFNLAVAAVWLPFTGPVARLLERAIAEPRPATDAAVFSHLDETALRSPPMALACAAREALRIADKVEAMLRDVILTFEPDSIERVKEVRRVDDEVDRAQEEIKLYLTRLTRGPLSEAEARQAFDLILFATNLEHVGDIIDKNLLELAAKKHRLQAAFSPEGWKELQSMHERAVMQARLAVTVFVTRDSEMARQLVAAKDEVRAVERAAADSHLRRLRDGLAPSIETSSLHLDILRDLKRIVAHLTDVAYPILEASGQLRKSRLA
jgi:phosphate:Na+ symporter